MSVKASEIIEKFNSLSPEVQEELARPFQDLTQKMFSDLAHKLMDVTGIEIQSIKQNIQESFMPPILNILIKEPFAIDSFKLSISDSFKGWLTGFMKEALETDSRYSNPSWNIVPPHITQSQPQVLNMYTVYFPVSNYMMPFLIIMVKRRF